MNPNTFTKGMNQDVLPKYQEEGTYRFALNAVLENELGGAPAISNELSNNLCSIDTPITKILIGSTLTDTDQTVLFYHDPAGDHEIGLFNPLTCTYNTLIHGSCLNFSDKYPINAISKIRNGCDRVIYFTDNYNKYRVINIDNVSQYINTETGDLQCDKLLYYKSYNKPCVFAYRGVQNLGLEDNAGGNLEIGVYYFAVRFLDAEYNSTEWAIVTRGVAVAEEPTADLTSVGMVNLYDGGSNTETSPFFVSKSNKAISLAITAQEDLFPFFQVAVIKRTSDSGALSSIEILKPKPFLGPVSGGIVQTPFMYNGNLDDIEREGTLEEILVGRQPIDQVASQAIKDDRNFLGGLSYEYRDYSKYQQYATKIKTGWKKTPTLTSIQSTPRKPNYYLLEGSFMEDETYAAGIVYVFSNGRVSPVFNIPGRHADTNIPNTAYNPLVGTGGVPSSGGSAWDTGTDNYGAILTAVGTQNRWKLVSTAYSYTSGAPTEGMMGYYECDTETYPDIPTCDNLTDGYWGRDFDGNLIVPGVTKIRHHRMPGAEFRDVATSAENNRTAFTFSNVEYPPDQDIIGHYFVYGDRSFDKLIQAKGVFIPLRDTDLDVQALLAEQYDVPVIPGSDLANFNYLFICAESLLNEKLIEGDYVKIEKVLRDLHYETGGINEIRRTEDSFLLTDPSSGDGTATNFDSSIRYFTKYNLPEKGEMLALIVDNLQAKKSYQGAHSGTETIIPSSGGVVINNSINHQYQFLHLNRTISGSINTAGGDWRGKMYYGSIRQFRKIFTDLFSIQYKRMNNCVDVATSTSTTFTRYGGDTATNRVAFTEFSFRQNGLIPGDVHFNTKAVYLSFPSQDSWINYEFRHGSDIDVKNTYFQFRQNITFANDFSLFNKYLSRKTYSVDSERVAIYPETYNYNNSFSYLDGIQLDYPLPYAYQYCNICVDNHPYRIVYSEKDTQETLEDKSRIVLANNYKDLNGLSGPITDLFVNFDNLYATTTNSTYLVPSNPQVFQTDTSDVYIGTGQVLSVPPRELKNTAYAFGGQQYFKSRVVTEYGTFFVDALSKRPLFLTDNLEDISLSGLRNFWQEWGDVKFVDQFFELTGLDFPFKSTSATHGVGYISTYDPRFKRIIVHKRDFKLLPSWTFTYVPLEEDIPLGSSYIPTKSVGYNGFNFYHNPASGIPELIDFDHIDFFENLSYTLSYSFLTKHWISFHSYLPNYIFNTSKTFLSATTNDVSNDIYKHNMDTHQTFYGNKFPHIVDLILNQNPLEQKTSSSIIFTSKAWQKDLATDYWKPMIKTYTSFIGYNTTQTTGVQELVDKTSPFQTDIDSGIALIKLTDSQWRLNNLRDLTIDPTEPIWNYSWAAKATTPYSFIDKKPYDNNINYSKSLFETARLKDHYLGARFILNSQEDFKLVTDLATVTYQNKNR